MTKIYLVRHCESIGNAMGVFQGSTDLDISDIGAKQLDFLEKRFSDITIDRVYSSPLTRAKKTARAISGENEPAVEIISGLRELHGGVVENKPFFETFNSIPGLLDIWENCPEDFAPEGGEPMRDAYERIWDTVLGMVRENAGKTLAAATHGGVLRCLHCRLLTGDISNLKHTERTENTAVTLLEFDDKLNPEIVFMNDNSHLPHEIITRPRKRQLQERR